MWDSSLTGERDGKYFLVIKDSPHENAKWVLYTERYGFQEPEFQCANVRDVIRYVNYPCHWRTEIFSRTVIPPKLQHSFSHETPPFCIKSDGLAAVCPHGVVVLLQIEYGCICTVENREQVDEFVEIMLEVSLTESPAIRIGFV